MANEEGARLEGLFKRPDVDRLVFGEPRDRQLIMRKVIKDPHVTAQLPNGTGDDWSRTKIVCEDAAKVMLFGDVTAALSPDQMKQVEHIGGILATESGQQLFLLGKAPRKQKPRRSRPLRPIRRSTLGRSKSPRARGLPNWQHYREHVPVRGYYQEIQFVRGAFGVENLVGMTMGMSPNLKGVEGFFDDKSWGALLTRRRLARFHPRNSKDCWRRRGFPI